MSSGSTSTKDVINKWGGDKRRVSIAARNLPSISLALYFPSILEI